MAKLMHFVLFFLNLTGFRGIVYAYIHDCLIILHIYYGNVFLILTVRPGEKISTLENMMKNLVVHSTNIY